MALARVLSCAVVGLEGSLVEVEVDVSPTSMPKTVLVGLAEAAVRESTHRVERLPVRSAVPTTTVGIATGRFTMIDRIRFPGNRYLARMYAA